MSGCFLLSIVYWTTEKMFKRFKVRRHVITKIDNTLHILGYECIPIKNSEKMVDKHVSRRTWIARNIL